MASNFLDVHLELPNRLTGVQDVRDVVLAADPADLVSVVGGTRTMILEERMFGQRLLRQHLERCGVVITAVLSVGQDAMPQSAIFARACRFSCPLTSCAITTDERGFKYGAALPACCELSRGLARVGG